MFDFQDRVVVVTGAAGGGRRLRGTPRGTSRGRGTRASPAALPPAFAIPALEPDPETGKLADFSPSPEEYREFLIELFERWWEDNRRISIREFDWLISPKTIDRPCIFSEHCSAYLVVEHNGDLYACDHYVEPNYMRGNIMETPLIDMVASEAQQKFGQDKRDTLPKQCRECEVRFICNGGCPKNRILVTSDGEPGLNYLCEGYKAFFTHIDHPMQMMVEELRQHRAPANVMQRLAQEDAALEARFAQANRNDPCPCGSGKKFKYCHGRKR